MSGKVQSTFGEFVRSLRKDMRLPLRKVAAELDIDASTLGKIERNARNPTNNLIEKMAVVFKTDVKQLKVLFLSDRISCELFDEDYGEEVLKLAEKKIRLLKGQR